MGAGTAPALIVEAAAQIVTACAVESAGWVDLGTPIALQPAATNFAGSAEFIVTAGLIRITGVLAMPSFAFLATAAIL